MKYYRAKNYAQALSFLEKAAAQGHLRALNNLGVFQLFGIGTGKNGAQAFTTLMKAASKGDIKASMLSSAIRMYGIEGGPRDPGKSIAFLTDMADRGNSMAAEHLVALYTMGLGVGKHDGLAFLNFMKLGR
jgi:TPR repeat protein